MKNDALIVLQGDCQETLLSIASQSVQCCVTSPPYWGLRDYGCDGQLGLESTPEEYVANMVGVFREVGRALKDNGTLWLNIGDSYASDTKGSGGASARQERNNGSRYEARKINHGLKPKDLCGIPWRLAFALQADGWYLRSDIIWHKPNPMPESVTDRPTKAHEYIFLLSKSERYFYDADAIKEPVEVKWENSHYKYYRGKGTVVASSSPREEAKIGERYGEGENMYAQFRNRRTVWTVATQPYKEAHFATFPEDLIKPCIMAGSRVGDTVLDPFGGSGTTGKVAIDLGRKAILCELNPAYVELIHDRTNVTAGML